MDSLLETHKGTCFICGRQCQTHKHHIFDGPNRKMSELHGLFVYLCPEHHNMGRVNVHNNIKMRRWLQEEGQLAFEETHTREEFVEIFGRNYVEEEE